MSPGEVRHPKLRLFWKAVSISFGVALLLLGVAGLFLPILQGWLLIFAGLAVLSPHSRRAHRVMSWLKQKLHIPHRRDVHASREAERETVREDRKARG